METVTYCRRCERATMHRHLHDAPYGLAGAHMVGSERYECKACGNAVYAEEGKKMGLPFVLDGDREARES